MWREALLRAIRQSKDEGHLKAETDPHLMLFELYSFTLGLHHDARFLHLPEAVQLTRDALDKTIVSYQTSNAGPATGIPQPTANAATNLTSQHTDSR
jgi:hypothetical protein